jgi:hypothetical protein
MSRNDAILLALGMLVVAAAAVGASGWILFARDHRLAKAGAGPVVSAEADAAEPHHEAREES